ncbi:MAG: type I CRISPR-associated protein Cas7, partial [Propionibacteriaceae bacterium]|nr:type I CRISPR-associated protein Cas7 [Propionibacteriaceae bacterium]
RDTVGLAAGGAEGYDIFVTAGTFLNEALEKSYAETGTPLDAKTKTPNASEARDWLCARYFDIRMFGAVLSSGR